MRVHLGLTPSMVQQQVGTQYKEQSSRSHTLLSGTTSSYESDYYDSETSSSSDGSGSSFDYSYQFQDKSEIGENEYEQEQDNEKRRVDLPVAAVNKTVDIVKVDIFSDEDSDSSFSDDSMEFDYDFVEPDEIEMDRETVRREKKFVCI